MVDTYTRRKAIRVFTVLAYIVCIAGGVVGGFVFGLTLDVVFDAGVLLAVIFALLFGAIGWVCAFGADVFFYTSFAWQEYILQEVRDLRRESLDRNLKQELDAIKDSLEKVASLVPQSEEAGQTLHASE